VDAHLLEPPFALEDTPDAPAVFAVYAAGARPYLARTARLRRRLRRLLGQDGGPSRLLNLRGVATRVEYWLAPSRLSASLLHYEQARRHYPEDYLRLIRMRWPAYVKVLLANEFPRTQAATRLSSSRALHYGPFRTRAGAERFEAELLDLFQVRRCQEDLEVSPEHPGCIYGEMGRCLRPCQAAVSADEYRSEALRLAHFLETDGASLLVPARAARDRCAEELNFEEAQRQHQRAQRIEQVLKLRDELAAPADRLCGVAVTPSAAAGCVELRFFLQGVWLAPVDFRIAPEASGEMVPLDRRLRLLADSLAPPRVTAREREEHLALLARWYYSSWRDGEWLGFPGLAELPYRRLVRAISRVASAAQGSLF
jgi:excinuclease UvrABC nuclease subunit